MGERVSRPEIKTNNGKRDSSERGRMRDVCVSVLCVCVCVCLTVLLCVCVYDLPFQVAWLRSGRASCRERVSSPV